MNKNMGNHKRKGPHRGQMQNKGKEEKEIHGGEQDSDMNQGKEINRVKSSDENNVERKKIEIHRAAHSAEQNVNREREVPRTDSRTTKKTPVDQKIHPVLSSDEKVQPREKETHRMVSWNKDLKDKEREISQVKTPEEIEAISEVEIQEAKSQAAKNTDSIDGYEATVRTRINNQDPVSQAPRTYMAPDNQSRMEDIRSAPAMGTVLYTVAALLVIGWVIGFFFYNAGDLIHVLLVLALFAVLITVAQVRSEESV